MKLLLLDSAMSSQEVYVDTLAQAQTYLTTDRGLSPRWTRALLDTEDGLTHLWDRQRGSSRWFRVTVETPSIQNRECCPSCGCEIRRS